MPPTNKFYKSILDHIDSGVYFVDRKRQITYWNKGAEHISGFSPETVQGRYCGDGILKHVNDEGTVLCSEGCPLAQVMEDGQPKEMQVYLQHADGHRVPVEIRAMPIKDEDGNVTGAVETFKDNSALINARQSVREFRRQSIQDPLTKLGNRRFIEVRLNAILAEFHHFNIFSGLLYLDIDNFKSINDNCGHLVGDKVLKTVSKTLLHNLREDDFIGRWGGDEFVCVLANVGEVELIQIGEKLRALVSQSCIEVDGKELCPTVSIGATLTREGDTSKSLLDRADRLLYQCKQGGKNCLHFAAE